MSSLESIPSSAVNRLSKNKVIVKVIAAGLVGAATMYYMLKGSSPSSPKFLLGQSEMVTNSKENETGIVRFVAT